MKTFSQYIPPELRTEKIMPVMATLNYRQKYSVSKSVGIKQISGSEINL